MEKEKLPDGKVTVNNVEKMEVDGLEIETKEVDGVIEVPIPQEIKDKGEDAVEKFKRRANDILNAGNSNYKKGKELNEAQKQFDTDVEKHKSEIEEKDKKLKELESEVEKQRNLNTEFKKGQTKAPSLKNLLAKRLGKDTLTADEIRDVQEDDPELYLSIQTERQDLIMDSFREENYKSVKSQISKDLIVDTIRREGYDVAKIEKFKLDNGFTDISKAYSFFKTQFKPSISPIDIVNKAERTKRTVKFIDSGNASLPEHHKLEDMSSAEIDALSPEENQRLYNELVKNR